MCSKLQKIEKEEVNAELQSQVPPSIHMHVSSASEKIEEVSRLVYIIIVLELGAFCANCITIDNII